MVTNGSDVNKPQMQGEKIGKHSIDLSRVKIDDGAHGVGIDIGEKVGREPEAFEGSKGAQTSQQLDRRTLHRENPRIYYLNGESLARPLELPKSARRGVIIIVAIAALIAAIAVFFYFDATTNEPRREQEQIQEVLARNTSLDLPNLLSMLDKDDAAIDAELKAKDATYFERSAVGSGQPYEIIKLPKDVTLVDAMALYAQGLSKLSATQFVTLLSGSWDLEIDRSNGLNMSLHYADFESGSLDAAIESAIKAEGLDRGESKDSGEDDGYGNAYTNGTILISGINYDWKVSAIPLKQMYAVAGVPDDATYVGIRILSTK